MERSWGELIDQYEAVAYLVCDCLRIELLPEEVRGIATKAYTIIQHKKTGAKTADDKLKGNAAAKRSKARKNVEKKPELAAGLVEKINVINKACFDARVELWGADADLNLPTAPIVESMPQTPLTLEEQAEKRAQELQAAAAAAEVRAVEAESAAMIAESEAERAAKSLERVGPCPTISYLLGTDMPIATVMRNGRKTKVKMEMPEKERECRMAELDRWELTRKIKHTLAVDANEARGATYDARADADELHLRVAEFAQLRVEMAQASAEAREAEARAASSQQLADEAEERAAAKERESADARQQLVRAEWANCRPEVVRRDAEEVWGSGWEDQERVAPTVYRLVGLSADEVRHVAPCVSGAGSSIEEELELQRSHNSPLPW